FSTGAVSLAEPTMPLETMAAQDVPTWDLLRTCVHCGLCLNHCPTYKVLGMEMDSPRGRIYQILNVTDRKMEMNEAYVTHIDRCLGCVACEIACPSAVKYGGIVERARAQIEHQYPRRKFARTIRNVFYRKIIVNFPRLSFVARMTRIYQQSGLQFLARKTGILKLLGVAE